MAEAFVNTVWLAFRAEAFVKTVWLAFGPKLL
jgi:hypothetical protein